MSARGGVIGGRRWPKKFFSLLSLHAFRPFTEPGSAAAFFRSPARQEQEPGNVARVLQIPQPTQPGPNH